MAKAIFITKHGNPQGSFEERDLTLPALQADEVKINVETFGLNYADVMARTGLYNDAPEVPFVPGYEVVGKVAETGSEVSQVKPGDRVVAFTRFGGYAREAIAAQTAVVKLPESISNEQGTALATQYCTAYYCAILMANIHEGEEVLVHAAAGGVGTAIVQLAKWRKCKVYGTASRPEKLDYLKHIGCDVPINYKKEDFVKVIHRLKGKDRIDAIFNPIGGKVFKKDIQILSWGGRHVLYGVSTWSGKKGTLLDKLKLAWDFGFLHPLGLLMKSQSTIGVNMLRIADVRPETIGICLRECVRLCEEGVLKPHVGGVFYSDEISKAHAFLEGRESMGKIAVNWRT
jgi:NADPH2:quinone reductase